MAIPDFQSFMRPLLKTISDGNEWHFLDTLNSIYEHFELTEEEVNQLLPSGKQTIAKNRTGWARTYLKKAGLLVQPQRGYVKITDEGLAILERVPDRITVRYLKDNYESFREFHRPRTDTNVVINEPQTNDDSDPQERLEQSFQEIQSSLREEVLDQVKAGSWQFFEKLVIDLMIAMGYGGARQSSGKATSLTNDNGIDGIINEDKLGLDSIYLQAKKWENKVQRPEIDKFIGALTRQGARKGVFITTSGFSSGAYEAVNGLNISVVLVSGEQLAQLMIEHGIGVAPKQSFTLNSIDTDYFLGE